MHGRKRVNFFIFILLAFIILIPLSFLLDPLVTKILPSISGFSQELRFLDPAWFIALLLIVFSFSFFIKKPLQLIPYFVAIGFSILLTLIIKYVIQRPRPPIEYHLVIENTYSFPSNHTIIIFTAAIIAAYYAPKFRIIFISVAILIGLSRILLGVHYLSDVVCGAFLGYLIAIATIRIAQTKFPKLDKG